MLHLSDESKIFANNMLAFNSPYIINRGLKHIAYKVAILTYKRSSLSQNLLLHLIIEAISHERPWVTVYFTTPERRSESRGEAE